MNSVEREIVVDARPETIFPFLVETEKHRLWEGTEVELDPRPGGTYRVLIGGQYAASGEYLEVVLNEKVAITFGWLWWPPAVVPVPTPGQAGTDSPVEH